MFGFQRIGDLIWLAGDIKAKGFLLGATAARTTLNGEGLQHEDGHSLLLAATTPAVVTYDPAFSFEVGHITRNASCGCTGTPRARRARTARRRSSSPPAWPSRGRCGRRSSWPTTGASRPTSGR